MDVHCVYIVHIFLTFIYETAYEGFIVTDSRTVFTVPIYSHLDNGMRQTRAVHPPPTHGIMKHASPHF